MAPSAPKTAKTKSNDFQKFIHTARERKKNEDLATKIFSSKRRQSAPSNLKTASPAGSLASRVGVKKQRASLGARAATKPTPPGNINGEWTHDLHKSVTDTSLAGRITNPNAPAAPLTRKQKQQQKNRAAALDRMDIDDASIRKQANIHPAPAASSSRRATMSGTGISIRGLAGPFTVMGQNFAPGTTAADIESAMTPIGGEMESCRIVKTKPFLMVEMVFLSREGGERVIQTFNDKTADGRLLKVYPKVGGALTASASTTNARRAANDQVVDGSMGFPDPNQKTLYSDKMVSGAKRGRGGQRGRGGR